MFNEVGHCREVPRYRLRCHILVKTTIRLLKLQFLRSSLKLERENSFFFNFFKHNYYIFFNSDKGSNLLPSYAQRPNITPFLYCLHNNIAHKLRRISRRNQRSEVESRTQGSRPRTQKKSEAKAKDSLSEDRHSRGQRQECSRPRPRTKDTSASALQKKKVFTKIFQAIPPPPKKKRSSQNFLQAISTKKRFLKNFSNAPQNFNNSKNTAVLEPRTGQFSRT